MITRIFVAPEVVIENAVRQKHSLFVLEPPIIVARPNGDRVKCFAVNVQGPSKIVYSPLASAERVWVETEGEVTIDQSPAAAVA